MCQCRGLFFDDDIPQRDVGRNGGSARVGAGQVHRRVKFFLCASDGPAQDLQRWASKGFQSLGCRVQGVGSGAASICLFRECCGTVPPAVNQVEMHPYLTQTTFLSFMYGRVFSCLCRRVAVMILTKIDSSPAGVAATSQVSFYVQGCN